MQFCIFIIYFDQTIQTCFWTKLFYCLINFFTFIKWIKIQNLLCSNQLINITNLITQRLDGYWGNKNIKKCVLKIYVGLFSIPTWKIYIASPSKHKLYAIIAPSVSEIKTFYMHIPIVFGGFFTPFYKQDIHNYNN